MINKICKSYIADIKTLLPIKRKEERKYIKNLTSAIEDYFEEADIKSKQDLYTGFGDPKAVVNEYISSLETDDIVKQIKIAKFIRRGIAIFLIIAAITATIFGLYMHHIYKTVEKMEEDLDGCYIKEVITVCDFPTKTGEPSVENNTTTATESAVENTTP